MVKLAGTAASVCQAGTGGPHDALPSPWCAASTCRWIRPSGRRSQLCRAAVSAAVLHGRAVTSTTGSPEDAQPGPVGPGQPRPADRPPVPVLLRPDVRGLQLGQRAPVAPHPHGALAVPVRLTRPEPEPLKLPLLPATLSATPSRGSGTSQLPRGVTATVSHTRSASALHR